MIKIYVLFLFFGFFCGFFVGFSSFDFLLLVGFYVVFLLAFFMVFFNRIKD